MLNFLMLVGACGFTACAGLGCLQEKQDNNFEYLQEEKVEFKQDNRKLVSYDDEEYTISLNANELNNYVFENLYNYMDEIYTEHTMTIEDVVVSLSYDTNSYTYDYGGRSAFIYVYSDYTISFNHNPDTGLNTEDYKFYFLNDDNNFVPFDNQLIFTLNEGDYSDFKQAIELDIQDNSPSDDMPAVLQDFVEILVGGIQSLATGIAGGIVSMAKALFLEVSQQGAVTGLSVFGGIVAIFAGLALAIGITTKVYQWVTSLGN